MLISRSQEKLDDVAKSLGVYKGLCIIFNILETCPGLIDYSE